MPVFKFSFCNLELIQITLNVQRLVLTGNNGYRNSLKKKRRKKKRSIIYPYQARPGSVCCVVDSASL